MIKTIDLYKEPLKILEYLDNRGYTGMSDMELSFLCGALKTFRPKKIVEIGVAAGGTTAVILNCLKLINCNCEMYSVDICKRCYLDISKRTGFVAEELLNKENINIVKHQFKLGSTIAGCVDKIGSGIDFVILDTMHSLPGELLDFISIYHFLDKNAVVVFHDVGQSQLGIGSVYGAPYEYASLVTLAIACGEKYLIRDNGRIAELSNIAAMRLNEKTSCSIENLFLGLFINWNYIPDSKCLNEYRQRIILDYDKQYYELLEQAIECNVFSLYRRKNLEISMKAMKEQFEQVLRTSHDIYVYGAGVIGNKIKRYIENHIQRTITGFVISVKSDNEDINAIELSELENLEQSIIILGLDEKYHLEVLDNLYKKGFSKHLFPYNGIGFRELLKIVDYENDIKEDYELYKNTYGYENAVRKGYGN